MLLSADFHLDDKPENNYRWDIFDHLRRHGDGQIYILGDLCDRADRHSAVLVNRLVGALTNLTAAGNKVTILCGNHDRSLKPPPYWTFLDVLPNVVFVSEPRCDYDLLLLPYSPDPLKDWADIDFSLYKCAFMHQTINGVHVGHGRTLENHNLLSFPDHNITVYSGDIHHCQRIGNVTYVGAPHPCRFGDSHRCRLLVLDDQYQIAREITLRRIRKSVIEITSVTQLDWVLCNPGDQLRIRMLMSPGRIEVWPIEQQTIAGWAKQKGVTLASVEAVIQTTRDKHVQFDFDADPERVLEAYCRAEGIGAELHDAGLEILRSSR